MKIVSTFFTFCILWGILSSCNKNDSADPKDEAVKQLLATHVHNIQGLRTWTHQYHYADNPQMNVYDTAYADTTFSLTVLSDTTVAVFPNTPLILGKDKLWVGTGDSAYLNSVIQFSRYPVFHNSESVIYYYNEDSLVVYIMGGSMGANWHHKFTSKK